ncbi:MULTISPECIES: MATE family efflux transporter [unclassified Clostridium]|uniref:MATE family efflux transporter n=1 Tax=unclassified Clostridium TaxID=2614128 RepID=UPI001C8B3E3C|nr:MULTISPECIES: MATE family efflux transporter [unclassified Clostridium]MBX9138370.1 MATE family efflux transporter [Clostridium sp. K12(2020)]MBX9145086.1 MATE family efflux transporter [Clostridium sp. K13]
MAVSENKNQEELGNLGIVRLLVKFSIPAIIGMVVNMLYNVVDRIYIGNIPDIGGLAITGVGITMPVTSIITGLGMLIGIGTSASISLSFGSGKRKLAQKYLGNGLTAIIIISLIVAIFGNVFATGILGIFGASENTMPYALAYIRPLMIGTICNLCAFGLNHSINSDSNPKIAMSTMLIGAIINIVLDPIFIFVLGLGIQGAAYATVISQFVAGCWVIYYFTKSSKSTIKLNKEDMMLNGEIIKKILMIGLAPFCMQVAGSIVQVIANNALMTYGGDLAIGAMAVITSVCTIFIMPIFGLNQGAQPIIGYNYGAKKYDRVKKTYLYGLIACTAVLLLSWIFIVMLPEKAIGMFNNDPMLTDIAVNGIRVYLFVLPLIGVQMTASNYYQAIGKPKKSMLLGLSRQVLMLIPAFLILPKFMGLEGVWLAGPIADGIAVILSGIIIIREMRTLGKEEEINKEISPEVAV